MQKSTRKAGRPSTKTDARALLIHHSRELFVSQAYDKVSTRQIAQRAGVNAAMIRYYFGSKEGLFETMIRETIAPMDKTIRELVAESSEKNFLDIMRTYYSEMIKFPTFPRLISQVMHMPPSKIQRKLLEKVFTDIGKPMQGVLFEKLVSSGVLKEGVDPQLCRVSYLSLMVFPFIAPSAMFSMHGIELTDEFLERLLDHNIQLMKHGFLDTQG